MPYLTHAEAHGERGGHENHIYQGDLFQTLSIMVPGRDGTWEEKQWDALVLSHDCEYTKIAQSPLSRF